MTLMHRLPPNRTYDQVLHHYRVEKAIADRLRGSTTRRQRSEIYARMYDELFAEVPDHPRLTAKDTTGFAQAANAQRLEVVRGLVGPSTVVVEFGPGDCAFARELAKTARKVYGVDVCAQTSPSAEGPENLEVIVYDGFRLPLDDGIADLVFSDQLIEHLHPDDAEEHFRLAHRLLAAGGTYVLRTPHALRGPHDVSRFFSNEPEGFHLKEWTYGELLTTLRRVGYSRLRGYLMVRGSRVRMPLGYVLGSEGLLGLLPRRLHRYPARLLLREVCLAASRP